MFQPDYVESVSLSERLRAHLGRRATAVIATLLLEALLVLAIWSLGQSKEEPKFAGELVSTFDSEDEPDQNKEEPKKQEEAKPSPQRPADAVPPSPDQPVITPVQPVQPVPPTISISPIPAPSAPPSPAPKGPPPKPGVVYGPPNIPRSGDSKRVGNAPNGEPLYAAAWYREPYDSELSGYLSTARGPGWGLIACKTAPDYRVEECVSVGESPDNSNIARAVLAAAWQFKVRPPRVGGRSVIGAWVRIRIDYNLRREKPPN